MPLIDPGLYRSWTRGLSSTLTLVWKLRCFYIHSGRLLTLRSSVSLQLLCLFLSPPKRRCLAFQRSRYRVSGSGTACFQPANHPLKDLSRCSLVGSTWAAVRQPQAVTIAFSESGTQETNLLGPCRPRRRTRNTTAHEPRGILERSLLFPTSFPLSRFWYGRLNQRRSPPPFSLIHSETIH